MSETLLKVDDLRVSFDTYAGEVRAVRGVSFRVDKGEMLAIVGESGSGKSVTAQSVMRLSSDKTVRYKTGTIDFNGRLILELTEKELCKIRGSEIGMILQDPLTSLNPTMTVGKQIAESIIKHQKLKKSEAIEKSIEMLRTVGIPEPEKRVRQYPHEFSGGMRQRVSIAIALACNPKLLIADEPTTALDVTIQAQVLELMKDLQSRLGTSIILITHDLGIVAEMADKIMIMYAGNIVESGSCDDIFYNPSHPYTWGLLGSIPKEGQKNKEKLESIKGTPPDLHAEIKGCPFKHRCKYAMSVCHSYQPPAYDISEGHVSRCFLHHEMAPAVTNPVTKREVK